ncbi:polysaccharide biosynthesis C-terminal domain-containing protein [Acinetobacter sp. YH01022]|uniref:polysaccharide biosynthesis C-terminal domain-containing protein n=1 Tax=Acinetobacter sp. YH01022 TaxID=2601036 RepID=UPI0015D2B723|nr:polysaccharide biosynthesis C-terminal domain-containing protein [Acinetobacter sp. YH01022]
MNNIFFSLGANIASKMIILLINVISFRLLLPEEYGVISLLLAMTATIGAISGMGASVAVNSIVARNGFTSLSALFVKYNYFISFLFSIILAIFIYVFYLDDINQLPSWQIFSFILFFSLFSSLNSISEAVLVGLKDFKKIFINNFTSFLIFLPISLYLIVELKVLGVLISLIAYRFLLFVINFYSVGKTGLLEFKSGDTSEKIKIYQKFKELSIPVIFSGLLVAPVIGLAFKIVSSQEQGLSHLAYFNIVYQVYLVAIFIPNALNGYFISKFSSKNEENENNFLKIAKNNFFFALVIASCLFIFQKLFFIIVDDYSVDLVNNYYIMLGTIVFFSLNAVFASYWPSIGKAWFGFYMNIIWAIVLLIVTFVFSKYEISAALSWAFFIAYLALTIVQLLSYKVLSYAKK